MAKREGGLNVRVAAIVDDWAIVRFENGKPYTYPLSDLTPIDEAES